MACSNCNGYYHCGCDIINMLKELKQKKMELELLQYKIKERTEEYNRFNEGHSQLPRDE